MNVTLLVFTDGRGECLTKTLQSADLAMDGEPITRRIIIDDSANPEYASWLDNTYGHRYEIVHNPERSGFHGAIKAGWEAAAGADFVFHLEDDFVFMRPVEISKMIDVLSRQHHIMQFALMRQPVAEQEIQAGGLMRVWPEGYTEVQEGTNVWCEHRLFFTTNPSLYRGELMQIGWPQCHHSEGEFSRLLFQNRDITCAYWGYKFEPHRVLHIGEERVGEGY